MLENRFISSIKIDWEKIEPSSYIRKIPSLNTLEELNFGHNITFFVGENGTGKSTLLEAIAIAYGFNPEGGSKNFNFSTRDTHSDLCQALSLTKGYKKPNDSYFLRAESFYNMASRLDEYESGILNPYRAYGGKSLHEQSHGESFLALMQNRFTCGSLYILDEPEAALSPQRQLSVLMHMHYLAQKGTQFIIASHSPILLGIPDAAILSFDESGITPVTYEETESYQVTEMFINSREYLLNRLL